MELVKIGITMGDPAGVGPETIVKTVTQLEINKPRPCAQGRDKSSPYTQGLDKLGKILVIGDRWVFNKVLRRTSHVSGIEFIDLKNVPRRNFSFGKVKKEYGQAAIGYLKKAVELIKRRQIDCLVTAPISKEAINLAGYKYNGHTEFLAKAFNKKKQDLVMMLLNKYIKISLVTRHLALGKVSSALDEKAIYKTILITYKALLDYFAIKHPRICVAALNPHAGEGGLLGKEEIKMIVPAVKRARRLMKNLAGPLPADSAFSAAKQGQFDAVVAMYHDQALIPLKILDFASGVNLTLGLGFVRTSPLHGTGFDIAGKNIASNASLVAALKTAVECTLNLRKVRKSS